MTGNEMKSVILRVDNQGAIQLAKNPAHHQRTKHISIKYHFIRDQIRRQNVILQYVASELNKADMFTKPLSKAKINKFNLCS